MEISKQSSGFSLVELIIVTIIIATISIMAYIRWSEATTYLDAQTSIFVNNLRYTQNLSLSKNERCRLIVTLPKSYDIQNSKNIHQPIPDQNANAIATLESGISFKALTNITANTIIFDGQGVPYTGNPEIQLTSDATIVLQNSSGQTATIGIAKTTGKISVSYP